MKRIQLFAACSLLVFASASTPAAPGPTGVDERRKLPCLKQTKR